ncbi:MAG TPA: hypothetical protein VFT42_03345 [Solirubrobacteraceae bacterium]|nr:hypothetical protein [Solirubrobacteraceae bacterium]
MKLAIGLIVLMAAGAIAAFVIAVKRDRDPVPQRVADCVQRQGGTVARTQDTLGTLRPDLLSSPRPRTQVTRYRLGRDRAVLLTGEGAPLLVLTGRKGPGLGGDVLRRAYEHPERFALVALAPPGRGALLDGCARASA